MIENATGGGMVTTLYRRTSVTRLPPPATARRAQSLPRNPMPYGSNDGYGRQQLRDRPSTALTDVGRRHMSGSSMSTLLSQGDEAHRGPIPTRHTAPGHAPPDCASFYPSTEEGVRSTVEQHVRHTPVQPPQGASRQALLSALEQANATIRQLGLELRAATRCGSAHDMGLQCEQLEEEQRELVRAFDDLSRVNGTLRKQLKQQAGPAYYAPPYLPCAHRAATYRAGGRDRPVARGAAPGGTRLAAASQGRSRPDRPGLPGRRGHGEHTTLAHAEQASGQAARAPEQADQPRQAQAAAQRGQSTAHRQPSSDLV